MKNLCVFLFLACFGIHQAYAEAQAVDVGCFKDNAKSRALNVWKGRVDSPQQCAEKCLKINKPYAGIQAGWGCRCGDAFYKYGASNKCTNRCKSGAICGGWGVNSVYKVASEVSVHAESLGCFWDNPTPFRPLGTWIGWVGTPEQCIQRCKAIKKPYAGIQAGWACRCGTPFAAQGFATNCNKKCKYGGLCGGGGTNSVYKVPLSSTPSVEIGCFWDNPTPFRPLKHWAGRVNTPQQCVDKCKAMNKPYAGIQAGWACRCGEYFYAQGFAYNCKNKCKYGGNCGGGGTNTVYKVGASSPGEVGCFKDNAKKRALTKWIGRVESPGQCIQKCLELNQKYAGIQDGWGCRCGNKFYIYGISNKCNKKCKTGEVCGGWGVNSIFRVPRREIILAKPVVGKVATLPKNVLAAIAKKEAGKLTGNFVKKEGEHLAEKAVIKGAEYALKKATGVDVGLNIGKHGGSVELSKDGYGLGVKIGKDSGSAHIGFGGDSVGFSYKGGKHPVIGESVSGRIDGVKVFEKGKFSKGHAAMDVGATAGFKGIASDTVDVGFHASKGNFGAHIGDQVNIGGELGFGGRVGISDKHGNVVIGGKVDVDLFGHKYAVGGKIDVTKDVKKVEHVAKEVGKDIKKGFNDVKHDFDKAGHDISNWFHRHF